MQSGNPLSPGRNREKKIHILKTEGSALLLVLLVVALLLVLVMGLSTFCRFYMRISQNNQEMLEARANARLSLELAIGELQKSLGPDTRISANARILESGGLDIRDEHEQFVGVWEAWRPDPASIGSYSTRKTKNPAPRVPLDPDGLPQPDGGFHKWLVSTSNPLVTANLNFPESGTIANPVPLVGSMGAGLPEIKAERVPFTGNGSNGKGGGLAWVVFDEGQKIAANIGSLTTTGTPLQRLGTQDKPALGHVTEWQNLAALGDDERGKLVSHASTQLAGNTETGNFSHDLTTCSAGLLTDVTLGKLRTDLSLLFANPSLPSDYQNGYIYSGASFPVLAAAGRGAHPHEWASPDPKWSLLHEFYRIPDTYGFAYSGDNAYIPVDFTAIPDRLIPDASNPSANPAYHQTLRIAPVISKAQFFFSLSFSKGGQLQDYWDQSGGNRNPYYSKVSVFIDPVITLWNPYDIPIQIPEFSILLYRLPLEFKFETSNSTNFRLHPTVAYSGFTDFVSLVSGSTHTVNNPQIAYPFRVVPDAGTLLRPGEHVVFSMQEGEAGSGALGEARSSGKAVFRPGWDPTKGGISSWRLFKNEAGEDAGQFRRYVQTGPNTWVAAPWNSNDHTGSIPVVPGDRIDITVQPTDAERGKYVTLGGKSVDFYLRYGKPGVPQVSPNAVSERADHPDFGAIELEYGDEILNYLPTLTSKGAGADLPSFPIDPADITNGPYGLSGKKPFLVATLNLKSLTSDLYRSQFPSKAWVNNNPAAIYASEGLGNQNESPASHQYEFSLAPVQGSWNIGFPEVSGSRFNGFGGPSPSAEGGRFYAPFVSIPRTHPISLAQLRHAPLNQSGKLPLQAQVLANSFAHPLLVVNRVMDTAKGYLDHSFFANSLFDRTFFSSAESVQNIVDLANASTPLINTRMMAYGDPASSLDHASSAASLMINGAFNVNSTSVNAWKAFLTAMNGKGVPYLDSLADTTLSSVPNVAEEVHISRYNFPLDEGLGSDLEPGGSDDATWSGFRKLDSSEIDRLADAIVKEVKLRGPFQSMAEFVNRRVENSDLGQMGALQAAIEKSGINDGVQADSNGIILTGTEDGTDDFVNTAAAAGSSLTGTPGYLLQGDLLNSMAPVIAVRSDTFKIRAYGDVTDASGTVISSATCEAVVQRVPDFVDEAANDPVDHLGSDSAVALSAVNRHFGRNFRIVSFRWLEPDEI